jgi:hypothetical protein
LLLARQRWCCQHSHIGIDGADRPAVNIDDLAARATACKGVVIPRFHRGKWYLCWPFQLAWLAQYLPIKIVQIKQFGFRSSPATPRN